MSTKIYYAYRVSKQHDIKTIIAKMKKEAITEISENPEWLKKLHLMTIVDATKNESLDFRAKDTIIEYKSGTTGYDVLYWMQKLLKEDTIKIRRSGIGFNLEASVGYDNDYWYFKFFPNEAVEYAIMKKIENNISELEDYHYQNQTDPPEDISYEDFEARDKKWEELLESTDTFSTMPFTTSIINHVIVLDLIKKYWHTGKDLYSHLAYKFDGTFKTI